MPETNNIFWQHKELLEILIKEAGVHKGKWIISANLTFAAGNFGSPEQMWPGGVVAIQQIGISRAPPNTPDQVVLDAAEVNPKKMPETVEG